MLRGSRAVTLRAQLIGSATHRAVKRMNGLLLQERRRSIGSFEVGRMLPNAARQMVGPFIFFDHLGPVQLPQGLAREADVRPHPHIGLATVTYLFEGEIMHRDSTAVEQAIRPHEVNWMTAGSGITHSERFERARREGGPIHALQAWVALPREREETQPRFAHHGAADLPLHEDTHTQMRLLAGEAYGLRSKVETLSPLFYVHLSLKQGARVAVPREYPERAVYLVSGAVTVDGEALKPSEMRLLGSAQEGVVEATVPSVAMLLGGEPVGPRYIEWNFVSSSQERIAAAKADWRAGRMKLPDADNREFIPLPAEPPPAANALS
jgi:redox-sensitive bicupin YhaK (pirin superfamily)